MKGRNSILLKRTLTSSEFKPNDLIKGGTKMTTNNLNPTDRLYEELEQALTAYEKSKEVMLDDKSDEQLSKIGDKLLSKLSPVHQPESKEGNVDGELFMNRVYKAANDNSNSSWTGHSQGWYYHFVEGAEWVIENILPEATKELTDEVERLKSVITTKNETIDELIDALKELCELKHYKDNVGRDAIYKKRQPEAWKQANTLLNNLIGYGEKPDDEDWSGGIADNH